MLFFALGIISAVVGFFVFSGYGWGFFFYLLGAFFVLGGIAWLVVSTIQKSVDKLPLMSVRARVFAKATETSGGGTDYVGNGQFSHGSAITGYFVSFEFGGHRENFAVDISMYNTVTENDVGLLEYKNIDGNLHFINFTRQT